MLWMLIQSLINGLLAGGVYALVAVGITIIFGVMKMINFAMGEFLMVGMYMTWIGYQLTHVNIYLLIPFVLIAMTIISYICFFTCMKPILGKGSTASILVTVGLSFFLFNLAQIIFGPDFRAVPSSIKTTSLSFELGSLGEFHIGLPRLIALGAAFLLVLLVNYLLERTLFGRAMRATSEKAEVAQMLGINTTRTYALAFMLGIVMAGLTGLLLSPLYYVYPMAGATYKTAPLMAVVLGGMGSIKGAFIGGLMIGVIEGVIGTLVAPDLGPAGIFVLFLFVLYFKPQGLFGKGERVA